MPFRVQNVHPLSHATRYARVAGESANPDLWNRHIGTLAPCIFGRQGQNISMIGGRIADDNTNPTAVLVGDSFIGKAYTNLGAAGAANIIRFPTAGGVSNPFKIDPPFTLSCVMRIPEIEVIRHYRILFATDWRQTALQKYAGVVICADDQSSTQAQVMQYDNTGVILDEIVRTSAGPTIVTSNDPLHTLLGQTWQHLIVRISPVIQGSDLDADANKHVRFWVDGLEVGSSTPNVGQSLAHAVVQHAAIGHIRTDAVFVADSVDIALWQLWGRMLSVGEINRLCADPLAMMRLKRKFYGLASSGRFVSLGGAYVKGTRAILIG